MKEMVSKSDNPSSQFRNQLLQLLPKFGGVLDLKEVKLIHNTDISSESQPAQLRLILDHVDIVYSIQTDKKRVFTLNPLIPWSLFPLALSPLRSGIYDVS